MMFRNFPMVSRVIFGYSSFDQTADIIEPKRLNDKAPFIFLVDDVFKGNAKLTGRIPIAYADEIIYVSTEEEPKTAQIDELVEYIILNHKARPSGVIGIGGGSVLDIAKAVSILLTNPGEAKDYQGWDLVKNPAVYHVGIPTISGTGAEVSRTTVLTGPTKKLGINSDYTPFDQVILDPELIKDVPKAQWFYTGMDCFIHCVESLNGSYLNAFSQSYGEKAYELCKEVFLSKTLNKKQADEMLMMASWHGGMSIAYSQVGIVHAMSYGLSYVLGTKHGIGNCLVFDQLEDYYPKDVRLFRQMMDIQNIKLPQGICTHVSDEDINIMIEVAFSLEPLWENALGSNWQKKISAKELRQLYRKI